jgi:hypothetical protein
MGKEKSSKKKKMALPSLGVYLKTNKTLIFLSLSLSLPHLQKLT